MLTLERRALAREVRADGRRLTGYAAVFNQTTHIAGLHERIACGAFRASLADGADILALADHDAARLLARTASGTLRLREDAHGLAFDLDLPDTSVGRDILALAQRGDLGGMSIGFIMREETNRDGVRELRGVDLKEISVVQAWPAYPGTEVQARAKVVAHISNTNAARRRRWVETL